MTASMRFTAFDFDASKYDAMLSDVNNLDNDRLKAISGLVRSPRSKDSGKPNDGSVQLQQHGRFGRGKRRPQLNLC